MTFEVFQTSFKFGRIYQNLVCAVLKGLQGTYNFKLKYFGCKAVEILYFWQKNFRYLSQPLATPFRPQAEILTVLFTLNITGSMVSSAVLMEVPRCRQ